MFSRANIAAGITAFLGNVIGAGVLLVTIFSVNGVVIGAGLTLSGIIALALFVFIYRWTAPTLWSAYGDGGVAVLSIAHAVLFVSNLIVFLFTIPIVYGALFDPQLADRLRVDP